MSKVHEQMARLLQTKPDVLENLEVAMNKATGVTGIFEKTLEENEAHAKAYLKRLGIEKPATETIRQVLLETMQRHEEQVIEYLKNIEGADRFEKAVSLTKQTARVKKGFFLKKEYAQAILKKRRPENLLKYLKLNDVDEIFDRYDVTEAFSALRFVESNDWMHKTFDEAYSSFTSRDFEERKIEIRALGPEWHEIAQKFLKKKRHNVSHLKEFGVIFLNPIKEESPGKFFRDFALLFHYLHEVDFYSRMFRHNANRDNFAERLKSLLRGDILEISETKGAEWLIVQRYLDKEDPNDPRLLLPRINPESLHWTRGERDLVRFGEDREEIDLEFWKDLDWVGWLPEDSARPISFDLEDSAMSLVVASDGRKTSYTYHQREAMWTKIFSEYVGGEEKMEELLIENFNKGIIKF